MCLYFFPWKSSKICISNFFLDFGRCEACLGLGLVDFLLDGFLVFFFLLEKIVYKTISLRYKSLIC